MTENIPPINLKEVFAKLMAQKKKYYYVLPITFVCTYLIMFCIPRYYTSSVSMAPEPTGSMPALSGSLGSLASSIGLSSLSKMSSSDALYTDIYPDIIASSDFIAELMTVEIETADGELKTTYYEYLRDHQAQPWWGYVIGTVKNWFSDMPEDQHSGAQKLDVFHLTKRQRFLFDQVQKSITCAIDKKTEIISINVKDQDPKVCALMADATCKKLQEFIINYRTNKARVDYDYYKKLTEQSKEEYLKAQQRYSAYADSHTDVVMSSYRTQMDNLENEMQLNFNVYTAMNTQMQSACAKLQEATPAFTVIESASMPILPAGPKRVLIAVAMTILAFIVVSAKIVLKKAE